MQSIEFPVSRKQAITLGLLRNHPELVQILFGGGAGGGKSWLLAYWLCVDMCERYPGVRMGVARDGLKKLRQSTWVTINKLYKAMDRDIDKILKPNWQDNQLNFKNGSELLFIDASDLPSDPMFERFGSLELTGLAIEEAAEVSHLAIDILQTRTGRHLNDKYDLVGKTLMTCNPSVGYLYSEFYDPWKNDTLEEFKAYVPSLVTDNPFSETGYIDNLRRMKNKAMQQRLLYGNWNYADDPYQLIKYTAILACQKTEPPRRLSRYMGVDVARGGGDQCVLVVEKDGHISIETFAYVGEPDFYDLADKVIAAAEANDIPASHISVDASGLGSGLVDILKHKGWKVIAYKGGSKAKADRKTEYSFKNLRAQAFWSLKENIENLEYRLPGHSKLEQELMIHKYEEKNEKEISLTTKEKVTELLARSPDYADALNMMNAIRSGLLKPSRAGFSSRKA